MKVKNKCATTDTFCYLNLNPMGLRTCDCATRALAGALNIGWREAIDLQAAYAKKYFLSFMTVYAVYDRYITSKYKQVLKVHGYYDRYDSAIDRADRLRRVFNKLHDVIIVPFDSRPQGDYTYMRGADEVL